MTINPLAKEVLRGYSVDLNLLAHHLNANRNQRLLAQSMEPVHPRGLVICSL